MEGLTALEILETLHGPDCVGQVSEIVVITKGSCYKINAEGKSDTPVFWPFEQGEILFLNAWGREPFGEERKPNKWDVEAVTCSTLAEARKLSEATRTAPAVFMSDYKETWTEDERKRFDS